MIIYIGGDHAGFALKRELILFLKNFDLEVVDCGPTDYDQNDDYPDYVSKVAQKVSNDKYSKGIVIGYSGQGEAMVANRFKNVRCAVFYGGSKHILILSREHNDSNILSIGAHFVTSQESKQAVELWISTPFSNKDRHIRRIKKIDNI